MKLHRAGRLSLAAALWFVAACKVSGGWWNLDMVSRAALVSEFVAGIAILTGWWRIGCWIGAAIPLGGMAMDALFGLPGCGCLGASLQLGRLAKVGLSCFLIGLATALLWFDTGAVGSAAAAAEDRFVPGGSADRLRRR